MMQKLTTQGWPSDRRRLFVVRLVSKQVENAPNVK